MYDKIAFGTEPARIGPHDVGFGFGHEPVHHNYASHEVGFGDDQATLGMSNLSQQIMASAMDIAPFHDVDQPGGQVSFGVEPARIGPHGVAFGIEYGDMSMSTFGNPPSEHLSFGHEGGHVNDGGATMGADAPDYGAGNQGEPINNSLADSTGGADPFAVAAFGFEQYEQHEGTDEAHRYTPAAFGFDQYEQHEGTPAAHRYTPGAFGSEGVHFGSEGVNFGCDTFGVEHPNPAMASEGLPGAIDLMAAEDGENMSYQPVGTDPYDAPPQDPTLRNPVTQFGFEDAWYSGFGPAPIIGCEGDLNQSDLLGCD